MPLLKVATTDNSGIVSPVRVVSKKEFSVIVCPVKMYFELKS